jgi:hypothetical protein
VAVVVALLGCATLLVGGSRLLGPQPTPRPSVTSLGSPAPLVSEDPNAVGIPELDEGTTFPPSIDGSQVLPVGPQADAAIAAATDATPFLISGWWIPALRQGCNFDSGTPAPDGVYFKDCAGLELASIPDGPIALRVYRDFNQRFAFPVDAGPTQVQRVLLRVHVHDAGCGSPDCERKPVLDETKMLGTVHFGSPVLEQTMPPGGVSLAQAIDIARPQAVALLHTDKLMLLRAEAGPGLLLDPGGGREGATWIWAVTFVTDDGLMYATPYLDYAMGGVLHTTGGTVTSTQP